jgi:DNA-binding CsgD family transcriptional regulator
MIAEMLEHCRVVLGMRGAMFAWLDDVHRPETDSLIGLNLNFIDDYFDSAAAYDPLRASLTVSRGENVATLSMASQLAPSDDTAIYNSFLSRHGFAHEVDIVLRDEHLPIGVLGLFGIGDTGFERNQMIALSLHAFMESHIRFHPRVRRRRQHRLLRTKYGLSEREAEIADLVTIGASNAAIADMLGIALSTTKTHTIKIMDKLGADSRMQVAAILQHL